MVFDLVPGASEAAAQAARAVDASHAAGSAAE